MGRDEVYGFRRSRPFRWLTPALSEFLVGYGPIPNNSYSQAIPGVKTLLVIRTCCDHHSREIDAHADEDAVFYRAMFCTFIAGL